MYPAKILGSYNIYTVIHTESVDINSVAMVFFKRTLQLGGGGKWPPRCKHISGSVPPRDKIPKARPYGTHLFDGKFFNGPRLTLFGDSFTQKFKMAPENRK